ncbi:MAG: phosphoglucomutase/phosphomannomutase family protein [candidate division NC10 bacterium]|nr:phosphoglucomutase/phosphomannomutase family protein [candidate division NC10 bacterium]
MTCIAFGTSGWRGIIADDFTFRGVRAVSQAIAEHLLKEQLAGQGVVIGYDTRFLSEEFAGEATVILVRNGIPVFLCEKPAPTPVVAYEIVRRKAGGGIIMTASHNPYHYNGFKFSTPDGAPPLPEVTGRIEKKANELLEGPDPGPVHLHEGKGTGLLHRIDPKPFYLEQLQRMVDFDAIRQGHLTVVVDPLYGAGQGYLDQAAEAAGMRVHVLHEMRDPLFGGGSPDPSEEKLQELKAAVLNHGASLGLATDGDADRYGIIDADGSFINPNQVLALLVQHLAETRGRKWGVARTVATSHLVDRVAEGYSLPLYETKVGFKYIGELLLEDKIIIGGEESAGLSIRGHVPEKDGILACLLVAEMVALRKRPVKGLLQELYAKVGTLVTKRIDLPLSQDRLAQLHATLQDPPKAFAGRKVTEVGRLEGTKLILEDGSWLLARPSGTEPVVRVYLEASSEEEIRALAEAAKALVEGV